MPVSKVGKVFTVISVTIACIIATLYLGTNVNRENGSYRYEKEPGSGIGSARTGTGREKFEFHVKSADDLRGRNIFYNRVGKCGSRSLLRAVWRLAEKNNFTRESSKITDEQRPEPSLAVEEIAKIAGFKPKTFYDRHIHYLDFGALGYPKPIYINMIREPIARFLSWYSYLKYGDFKANLSKKDWPGVNECIASEISPCTAYGEWSFKIGMYFCGLDPVCKIPGPERVNLAKSHIDKEYALVGVLEDFPSTLKLLEAMMPDYFSGVTKSWEWRREDKADTATTKKENLTEASIVKMKNQMMVDEYEVYNYAKAKFEFLKAKYGIH